MMLWRLSRVKLKHFPAQLTPLSKFAYLLKQLEILKSGCELLILIIKITVLKTG